MKKRKDILIRDLHERLITKFTDRIGKSISNIQLPVANNKADDPDTTKTPQDEPRQEINSPDKINEIRNKVAAEQTLQILNPDKQNELLEILNQGYEEFVHKLREIVPEGSSRAKRATEKFKDELMINTQYQLAEKKHSFAN